MGLSISADGQQFEGGLVPERPVVHIQHDRRRHAFLGDDLSLHPRRFSEAQYDLVFIEIEAI